MKRHVLLTAVIAPSLLCAVACADVQPNSLFSDHAVLQRGIAVPIWGTAAEGERVTVELAGQSVSTTAQNGRWRVQLEPLAAGGPFTLTIKGNNTVAVTDVLVGEVWICSGQSNMERELGPTTGQKPIVNWEQEVAAADYPRIRQFYVPKRTAFKPIGDAESQWVACSPDTVIDFSAVGYFFARDLYKAIDVPIGMVFSAWGGTVAEAWTGSESLETMSDFREAIAAVQEMAGREDPDEGFEERLAAWYRQNDPGSAEGLGWADPDLSTNTWRDMTLPTTWEEAGLANHDGVVWFRKVLDLSADWEGKEGKLNLGPIDDEDVTWINGVKVGSMENWQATRMYTIPAGVLRAGRNVIAVRVLDTSGPGGVCGQAGQMSLESGSARLSLAGPWQYRASASLGRTRAIPRRPGSNPNTATVLYNGMLAPLQPYALRGVIWYQGESNDGRTKQYQKLFPLMIADWRRAWGQGDFPFLFVQIAPYNGMSPEIREAQFLTLDKSPNTAMAVITDAGDAEDIHPAYKQPVGARLALAARALAYGEDIEYSGPLYKSMTIRGNRIVLSFTHTGSGLMAKDGELKGFVMAGPDKQFVPAHAEIVGETVEVWSDDIVQPVAARYGWANVPEVNLYNTEGLPASPFRTDVD